MERGRLNRLLHQLEVVPKMWHVPGLALIAKEWTARRAQEESWATTVWTAFWDRPWGMKFGSKSIQSCGGLGGR
jgi:hypothetical protein